jgi:uncharacterized protein (DUF427 family)
VGQPMKVEIDGDVIASSNDVIRVVEDGNPARYYFPRADVSMRHLAPSDLSTSCPFKGEATYFTLELGSMVLRDVVWRYENPYDEHRDLRGRVAFYEERIPGIHITDARASRA